MRCRLLGAMLVTLSICTISNSTFNFSYSRWFVCFTCIVRVFGVFAQLLLVAFLFLAHLYVPLQMCAVHFTSVRQLLQRYILFGHIYVLAYLNLVSQFVIKLSYPGCLHMHLIFGVYFWISKCATFTMSFKICIHCFKIGILSPPQLFPCFCFQVFADGLTW